MALLTLPSKVKSGSRGSHLEVADHRGPQSPEGLFCVAQSCGGGRVWFSCWLCPALTTWPGLGLWPSLSLNLLTVKWDEHGALEPTARGDGAG